METKHAMETLNIKLTPVRQTIKGPPGELYPEYLNTPPPRHTNRLPYTKILLSIFSVLRLRHMNKQSFTIWGKQKVVVGCWHVACHSQHVASHSQHVASHPGRHLKPQIRTPPVLAMLPHSRSLINLLFTYYCFLKQSLKFKSYRAMNVNAEQYIHHFYNSIDNHFLYMHNGLGFQVKYNLYIYIYTQMNSNYITGLVFC